jgi:hypothetical protein
MSKLSFTFDPESDVVIWVELGVGTGVHHACCISFRLLLSAFGTGFIRISFLSFWFILRSTVVVALLLTMERIALLALSLAYSYHDGTDMCLVSV